MSWSSRTTQHIAARQGSNPDHLTQEEHTNRDATVPPFDNVHLAKESFKEGGNSFQHFSNSYSLKDEY